MKNGLTIPAALGAALILAGCRRASDETAESPSQIHSP